MTTAAPPAPAGTTTPPPAHAPKLRALAPYRWTLDTYRRLGPAGLFRDAKTMLLRGELFVMTLPGPHHNLCLGLLEDWLRGAFAVGHHVRNQMAFDIGTDSDPGPDLAVVVGSRRDYADQQPTGAALIVEIADSSLAIDTTTKAELYATAGVPEYWVLDISGRELIVFRDPQPLAAGLGATVYQLRNVFGPTESVSPLGAPHATVCVGDLLP
jgi:Uma2 family endonuclease